MKNGAYTTEQYERQHEHFVCDSKYVTITYNILLFRSEFRSTAFASYEAHDR